MFCIKDNSDIVKLCFVFIVKWYGLVFTALSNFNGYETGVGASPSYAFNG